MLLEYCQFISFFFFCVGEKELLSFMSKKGNTIRDSVKDSKPNVKVSFTLFIICLKL